MSKVGLIFPGQGSQSIGMLDNLLEAYPEMATWFKKASHLLDKDLLQLIKEGPEEVINATEWTQPALLTASVAIYHLIKDKLEDKTVIMAGHSLGEYSAMVCAGKLDFEDAVNLVHKRGQYMQSAVEEGAGAMAAVMGLESAEVESICEQASTVGVVNAANYNSATQIVIAGTVEGVDEASRKAAEIGAKVIPLSVSVPSHCALMMPAAEQLKEALKDVQLHASESVVIHNYDVQNHTQPETIKMALVQQLFMPVRWFETMQYLAEQQVNHVLECGPGKVLSALFKRFDRSIQVTPLSNTKGITEINHD